jgi:integrase
MAASHKRRARGEGSIYPTARDESGRAIGWRGSLLVTDPTTRRPKRRYVSGRTADDVRRKLTRLRADEDRGATTAAPRLTTGAYLDGWIGTVAPTIRPSTLRGYAHHVETYWKPALGTIPLSRLAPADVKRAMDDMTARGLSAQTIRGARSTLRRALREALVDGLVSRNAAALARPPRLESREIDYLDPADVRAMIAATAGDRLGPMYAVAATTGLRLGELCGLEWSDVDSTARTLTVRRALARDKAGGWSLAEPKTARSRRTVPLPAVALEALERRRQRQDSERDAAGSAWQDVEGLIFTDAIGRPLPPLAASRAWRDDADRVGIRIPFRALRHTAATTWLRAGVPLIVVSEALGHTGISVTAAHYAAVAPELRQATADAMDRALGGAS